MSYDIFISYSSRDKSAVLRLAKDLESAGLKVWLDEWEILVGDRIVQKIQEGIEGSDFVAVWLTKHAVESGMVETEWQMKCQDEIKSGKTKVLPLLAEECNVPKFLEGKRYADFRSKYLEGLKQLLEVFQPKYKNKLELWPILRKYFIKPKAESLDKEELESAFTYRLDDFPYPFIDVNKHQVDMLFISGPTRYELEKLDRRFYKKLDDNGKLIGFVDSTLGGDPIILGESAYNLSLASEILSEVFYIAGKENIVREKGRIHLPYMEVNETILAKHNIVCIPCGDVNPLLPVILKEFEMKYEVRCPVHHQSYETSESIKSEVTNQVYEKTREGEWAGYVLLIPNPWNPEKAALVCGGNRGVGTQAALLRILIALRGEMPLANSKGFPYKVVTAKSYDKTTMIVTEVRELE